MTQILDVTTYKYKLVESELDKKNK